MGEARKNTFVKQAAVLAGAGLFVRFIGFLYRLPLTAMLGDVGNSIYSSGYYIYTFFLIMSSAGLPAAISKMVSERLATKQYYNAHKVFKIALAISFATGSIAMIILFTSARWIEEFVNQPGSAYSLMVLSPTLLIVSVMAVFRGYFQGMKNNVPTATSQIIEQIFNAVFSLLAAYVLLKNTGDIAMGAAGGTAGTGIGAFAGLIFIVFIYFMLKPDIMKRVNKDRFEVEQGDKIAKEIFMVAMPIIMGTAIFSVTNIIDMKMVMSRLLSTGMYTNEEAQVLYGQLTGKYVVLTTLPVSIATALSTTIVPNIAGAIVKKDYADVYNKVNISFKITTVLCLPASVGIGVLGNQILLLLFPKYPDGGNLLIVGSISIIFLALSQISTGILQGMGKLKIPVYGAFLGALVKIPLNYFLIGNPRINVVGAVISTIFCYVVASAFNMSFLRNTLKIKFDVPNIFIKPLFASFIMGMACYIFYNVFFDITNSNTIGVFMAILISIIVYFFTLISIGGLSSEDLKYVPMGNKIVGLIDVMK